MSALIRDMEGMVQRNPAGRFSDAVRSLLGKARVMLEKINDTGVGEDEAVSIIRAGLVAIDDIAKSLCTHTHAPI